MKLPPQAKKVFKGQIFDVYQWQQPLYNAKTATFEMLKRPSTIQIIPITPEGKIVIGEEEQPTKPLGFTFLGGRAEENEEILDTAKRELLEEAGLSSDNWILFFESNPEHKIDWQIFYYIAKNCKKVSTPKLDPGEKIDTKEVGLEEFIKMVLEDNFWCRPEFKIKILEMMLDSKKLEEFKKLLS